MMSVRIERIRERLAEISDKQARQEYSRLLPLAELHECAINMHHPFNKDTEKYLAEIVGMDMDDPQWSEGLHRYMLELFEYMYVLDGSPDIPWIAIQWCHTYRVPVPEWLVQVFVGFSQEILAERTARGKKREIESTRVGRILGYGGTGPGSTSAGSNARRENRDQLISLAVAYEKLTRGTSLEEIYELVGEKFEVSAKVVERAYHRQRTAGRSLWKIMD